MQNKDIRDLISKSNLKYWQVANKYGISDGNFSRLLRYPVKKETKEKIINTIKILKEEKNNEYK